MELHERYKFKFDARRIIENFGGAPRVAKMMRGMGADISLKGVQKMRERDYIQSDALATLMAASIESGEKFDLDEFLCLRG